jgi:hypothetical protein
MNTKLNARLVIVVAGAALALGGASIHSAGAANALACGAKKAHTAAVTAQKPFYSPLNPRGLLNAGGKNCAAKAVAKKQPQKKQLKPAPKQQEPSLTPAPIAVPSLPGPAVPLCPVSPYDTEGELTVCPPAQPSDDGAATVDQAATDQPAPDVGAEVAGQSATGTDQSPTVDPWDGSTGGGGQGS